MSAPQYTELDRMGNSCNGRGGQRPRYFFLHTQEGDGSAESLAAYLNDPSHDASYHYALRDGVLADVVDTDKASWSVGDANGYSINLCFAGSFAGWSREQWLKRDADLRIAAYIAVQDARKYGFSPIWLGSGGHYDEGPSGVSDHQYVTDVIGWGTHTDCGPGFPGDVFARYLAEYAGGAVAPTPGEDDEMDWTDPIPKPNGKTEQAGVLVGWIDQHAADILDQLAGPGTKDQRGGPLRPTGWPQLGKNADGSNRTVVDGLAAALSLLGQLDKRLAALEAKDKA